VLTEKTELREETRSELTSFPSRGIGFGLSVLAIMDLAEHYSLWNASFGLLRSGASERSFATGATI